MTKHNPMQSAATTVEPVAVEDDFYSTAIVWSQEDQAYLASTPELPGCIADGQTKVEALKELADARSAWIGAANEIGKIVPKPTTLDNFPSGLATPAPSTASNAEPIGYFIGNAEDGLHQVEDEFKDEPGIIALYATPPSSGNADAVRAALTHAKSDLEASRTLAREVLGEPHGINQTIELINAALFSAPVAGADTVRENVREHMVELQIKTIESCMNLINNIRMSEAGILDDPRFAGQRGKDRSDAFYDVFHMLWAVAKTHAAGEETAPPLSRKERGTNG